MKLFFKFMSIITFLAAITACAVAQGTVADAARAYRKTKSANAPVLTNESLSLRTVSSDSSVSATTPAAAADGAKAVAKAGDKPADDSAEGKQKLAEEWKGKIDAQKAEVVQLQRELDVAQRENKLRAASFYADAGTRLRDSAKYAEEDRKYQAEIAGKQTAIATAQQAVEKMRDEARRAGVPAGQIP